MDECVKEIPKVSVIVPVYKAMAYLEECVSSLQNQTLSSIEILLVDDGSPDESGALCERLAEQDERIRVFHQENGGPGAARNKGIQEARGEFLSFLDSDDTFDPEMLENLYLAAKETHAQLVISGTTIVGGSVLAEQGETEDPVFESRTLFATKEEREELLLGTVGSLPWEKKDTRYGVSVCKNLYCRKTIVENQVLFLSHEKYLSEDALFMLDMILHVDTAVGEPGVLYRYYYREGSVSKIFRKDRLQRCRVFLKAVEERLQKVLPPERYQIYLDRLCQAYARVFLTQEILYAKEATLSRRELRERMVLICEDEGVRKALSRYPWYRLPVKQAIFAFAMKYRWYWLQTALVMLRK